MPTQFVSSDMFLQILDSLSDLVLVKGEKSRVVWANKAFREFYGITDEQLRGMIDSPVNNPDYTQQYMRDDLWVFQNGKVLDIPKENVTRHDGVEMTFHTIKSPILDGAGQVSYTVGISRDITEQIAAEKLSEAHRAKLEYASRMVTLGEVAGGIAHEINTPLATIQLLAGLACESMLEENPDLVKLRTKVERIEASITRIAKIVSGMKKLSRDGRDDTFVTVSLGGLIDDALFFCAERASKRGIEMKVVCSNPEELIECVPAQISQVVLNLISNAIDAVERVPEKWIRVEAKVEKGQVAVAVMDSGSGVPKNLIGKIFEPFFTTKQVGQGTGLGLSISRGIAVTHGGDLTIVGDIQTEFVLAFPRIRQVI